MDEQNIFMSMMKNKEQVVKSIFQDLATCEKNMKAFEKLESLYDEGKEVNNQKVIKACSRSIRHLNDANRRMLMLLACYSIGGNFDADAAKVLLKMGRGEEALREMFKQKMQGR
jgi:hypothetical protein